MKPTEIFKTKVYYNQWLNQLTEDEKDLILQMLTEAQEKSSRLEPLVRRCADLEEELKVTDRLLTERQKVLDAIPECKAHGKNCVPNALEWIAEQLRKASA